jgi:hypothetical protein
MQTDNSFSSFLNLKRQSHIVLQKKFHAIFDKIATWIDSVGGQDKAETIEWGKKYLHHLNDLTKKSYFNQLLTLSKTNLVELGEIDKLRVLVDELYNLKSSILS